MQSWLFDAYLHSHVLFLRRIEESLKAKKIALTKEEVEGVMDTAVDKLSKLTYKMPPAEPINTPVGKCN